METPFRSTEWKPNKIIAKEEITFPEHEIDSIIEWIKKNGHITTHRSGTDYHKYKLNHIYNHPIIGNLQVKSICDLSNVKYSPDFKYMDSWTQEQQEWNLKQKQIERICLKWISDDEYTNIISQSGGNMYLKKYNKYKHKYMKLKQRGGYQKIIVEPMTPKYQFNCLMNTIKNLKFFKEHNYNVPLPNHSLFNELYQNPSMIDTIDVQHYYDVFEKEVYVKLDTEPINKIIIENKEILETFLHRLEMLKNNWNFKLYDLYIIFPELWSSGGSYWYDDENKRGIIKLKTNDKGVPMYNKNLVKDTIETIYHEIVHIGIEENIVQKLHLSHSDKECIVDLICSVYFHDLLPYYYVQREYINQNLIANISYNDIEKDLPIKIKSLIYQY
jgi:hypothetical protein